MSWESHEENWKITKFFVWCESNKVLEAVLEDTSSGLVAKGKLNKDASANRLLEIEKLPEYQARWYSGKGAVYSIRPRDNKSVVANGGFVTVETEIILIDVNE